MNDVKKQNKTKITLTLGCSLFPRTQHNFNAFELGEVSFQEHDDVEQTKHSGDNVKRGEKKFCSIESIQRTQKQRGCCFCSSWFITHRMSLCLHDILRFLLIYRKVHFTLTITSQVYHSRPPKQSSVRVVFVFIASFIISNPSCPISFPVHNYLFDRNFMKRRRDYRLAQERFNSINVVFVFKASLIALAPSFPAD